LISMLVLQHAYHIKLAATPSRTLFAVATRHADQVEIYRADGTRLTLANPPFGFFPEIVVQERGGTPALATGPDLRFGYIDAAATETRLYVLFSGRTRRGFPGTAHYGKYVHVYDWAGSLSEVFQLDAAALAIATNPDTQDLYAIRHHPTPAVIRYCLGPQPRK
jgi:hypothetical protein